MPNNTSSTRPVLYLFHDFFKNFCYFTQTQVGDLTVTDLRTLKYNIDGTVQYKVQFGDKWRKTIVTLSFAKQSLCKKKKSRKNEKFIHLQSLKTTIVKYYNSSYIVYTE